jgi:hypothetical protein
MSATLFALTPIGGWLDGGQRSDDVRNEGAEIAASAAALHQEAACWRGHAKLSHKPQYQKSTALTQCASVRVRCASRELQPAF